MMIESALRRNGGREAGKAGLAYGVCPVACEGSCVGLDNVEVMDPSAAVSKPVEGDRVDVAVGVGVVEHRR